MVANDARGVREIRLITIKPDGTRIPGPSLMVRFEDDSLAVHNWVVVLNLKVGLEGIHWIEWTCNDRTLTRLPLRIAYVRKSKSDESVP